MALEKANSQGDSVQDNQGPLADQAKLVLKKKNILIVFAEIMKLMNTDKNIKQFSSRKYPEAIIQLNNFKASL